MSVNSLNAKTRLEYILIIAALLPRKFPHGDLDHTSKRGFNFRHLGFKFSAELGFQSYSSSLIDLINAIRDYA